MSTKDTASPEWRMVPLEPTDKMLNAAESAEEVPTSHCRTVYRAMLAAAPSVEAVHAPGQPQADLHAAATPGAQWRAKGEPDPHGTRYDCERAALALGSLSDDELANGAFMNYDVRLSVQDMLSPKPGQHMPIVWMTAVKDRIRWLSRRLEEASAAQLVASAQPQAVRYDVLQEHAKENGWSYNHLCRAVREALAHPVPAAASAAPAALEPSDEHAKLMKFYGVSTLEALVDMQSHHIERLQAKLPQSPNIFAPQRVREG